jgi:hypothetical protein
MTPEQTAQIDRLARKRAGAKLRWYAHASVYVLVNVLLFSLASMGQHRWSVFPALGWGLGLALHGLSVWMVGSGSDLRERMVQKERDKLTQQWEKDPQDKW